MWNPQEKPFVVGRLSRTSSPGLHGWNESRTVYATEAEARAAFDAPLNAHERRVTLWDASTHPKWKQLAQRKSK